MFMLMVIMIPAHLAAHMRTFETYSVNSFALKDRFIQSDDVFSPNSADDLF